MWGDEVQHDFGIAVAVLALDRRSALGVHRRPPRNQRLTERAHPKMVLIQLLAPGQRSPGDEFVDVGVARVVADLLAFDP